MEEKLVLIVDDDRLPMRFYVRALEQKGFAVKHCLDSESALDFVKKEGAAIRIVILDIMMPPGTYSAEETNEGLRTGFFLLKDLRKECPNVPVLVLTNVKNEDTLKEFKEGALLKVVQKMYCPPFDLVELVEEMASGADN